MKKPRDGNGATLTRGSRTLRWTLALTALSLLFGGVIGFVFAIMRVSPIRVIAGFAATYIGVIQGVPALMLLFLSYYGLSLAGLELPPLVAASASLALYVSGYLADIWRGAIQSVPWQYTYRRYAHA